MSNILIEARHISKVYDPDMYLKRGKNFYALRNVNFVLEEGDFTCIMGPSGSGKSTLLNCLSTLDSISSGNISLDGTNMSTLNKNDLCDFRYQSLGFVFQNHNLIPYLTIFDNIATPIILGRQDAKTVREKVIHTAQQLEIEDLLDKFPHECSGGECQRVAIARALINDPKIIFCDEPTGNLDSKNSHKVLSILTQLNQQGTTILLVTHDAMIASYARTMMYLYDGGIKTVIHRNKGTQVEFFQKINEITTQDSLLKKFSNEPIIQDNISSQDLDVQDIENEFITRQTVYMMIDGQPYDEDMLKNNTSMLIKGTDVQYRNKYNDDLQFDLSNIQSIHLDLKAQFVNFGFFSQFNFFVLVDFISEKGTYMLQTKNKDDFISILQYFHSLSIPIDDPRKIEDAYHKYPKEYERQKFFQRTHKDLTAYNKQK